MILQITLTDEQEQAIIGAHGSTDYIQTYVSNMADYEVRQQDEVAKAKAIKFINEMSVDEINELVKGKLPISEETKSE